MRKIQMLKEKRPLAAETVRIIHDIKNRVIVYIIQRLKK
jgi:hypothetical protein